MSTRKDKGCHAVYTLQFHYICCVKYRSKVFNQAVSARLYEIQLSVANDFGVRILEQKTDTDHVHILFASKPQVQLSKFINSLKSVSSRLLRKEFPHLTKLLCKGAFWSPSYFLASCGDVSLEVLRSYVQQQGHDTNTTNGSGASR